MNVLVVGGGGREHALVWRLAQDPDVRRLLCAPGNAGITRHAACVPIAANDIRGIVELVERERIDLTVVGPEAPLSAGLADELEARHRRVFGASRAAARLETSKAWAKSLCERHGIPAARARTATSMAQADAVLDDFEPPYVVKADGLAAGKGVVIAPDRSSALEAMSAALEGGAFGEAGSTVLVEEHLVGREVSAFALSDGHDVVPLAFAQDFKRVWDGDAGPNTGGMGAYSPVPFIDDEAADGIQRDVLLRTIQAMEAEGTPYRGVLYAGLMLVDGRPRVLEFNARFGDPETQALLPRLRSDLVGLCLACADGGLSGARADLSRRACVTVVIASRGYPERHEVGVPISGLEDAEDVGDAFVFHSGTAKERGRVVTSGGRVLSVSGTGDDLAEARARAYEACSRISFEGMQYRKDIAARAAGEERR